MPFAPRRLIVLALAAAVLLTIWAGGSATGQESDADVATLSDYGPKGKAPSGPVLPGREANNRWKYRGTLGKLGNREEVVPPVVDPPENVKGRAPLTGKSTNKALRRPAMVVKIDNVAQARPQTAINQADIVYEELVEAGATRLAAVFHSKQPTLIGPVRSARPTDIGIAVSFDRPIFAFSGANSIVDRLVARARVVNRSHELFGGYFRRGGRPAPHNLYTSSSLLQNSVDGGKAPPAHFEYRAKKDSPPSDVPTAHTIQVKYQRGRGVPVRYQWDANIGGWRRWQNGRAHIDSSGVQVAPENVVVQLVPYTDAGMTDKFGEDLYEAQMVGTGDALVFTDGHVIAATWTKPTLRAVTTFTDANGEHVKLTKGRTWVSLVAPGGVTFNSTKCKGQIATVAGTNGDDFLKGTDDRDVIAALDGDDTVAAKGGNDLVCGGAGDDSLFGQAGNDKVFGGPGDDDLRGGAGNDRLNGNGGDDQLHGEQGTDVLKGKGGADQLFGQNGVDTLRGLADVHGWGQ